MGHSRIASLKVRRHVGNITSGERDEKITLEIRSFDASVYITTCILYDCRLNPGLKSTNQGEFRRNHLYLGSESPRCFEVASGPTVQWLCLYLVALAREEGVFCFPPSLHS